MPGLRFLVDVGVGKAVQALLRERSHDVVCVRDIDPRCADKDILLRAETENRIVVTMDKDFGELVYRSGQPHSGVLLLRLDNADGAHKARVVDEILTRHGSDLARRFCVYQDGRLRIRR